MLLSDFYSLDVGEELMIDGELQSIIKELDNFGCSYFGIHDGLQDNLIQLLNEGNQYNQQQTFFGNLYTLQEPPCLPLPDIF